MKTTFFTLLIILLIWITNTQILRPVKPVIGPPGGVFVHDRDF